MNRVSLRQEIWNELLEAAWLVRYYRNLSDRYHKIHKGLRIALALSAFGVLSPDLFSMPESPETTAYTTMTVLAVVGLVIWDLIGKHSEKGSILHYIAVEWREYEDDWRDLWQQNNDHWNEVENLAALYRELKNRRPIESVEEADIAVDEKLNKQCWEAAIQAERNRYAA